MNYQLIADVDDVGILAVPFAMGTVVPAMYNRLWMDRGLSLNRYSGEIEMLTMPVGFGEGEFGNGVFGWS